MTTETLYQTIFQLQKVEYALCNAARQIVDISPGLAALVGWAPANLRHQSLDILLDSFSMDTSDLARIQNGTLPTLTIEKIHRPGPNPTPEYLTITIAAYRAGLLVLFTDVTAEGRLEQRITQQRNELNLLAEQLSGTQAQLNDLLRRFVPMPVAEQLIADPTLARLGGERREVTLLFADIYGFPRWAEKQEPEAVVDLLNQRLAVVVNSIMAHGGMVCKLMGETVLGLFNAPYPAPQHAWQATQTAWELITSATGPDGLPFRVGLSTGVAVVGNIGAPQSMDYVPVGDTVNLARHLQGMAQGGQALLTEATYQHVRTRIQARLLGTTVLQEREQPARVLELLGL